MTYRNWLRHCRHWLRNAPQRKRTRPQAFITQIAMDHGTEHPKYRPDYCHRYERHLRHQTAV
jgi:hypothetical protein